MAAKASVMVGATYADPLVAALDAIPSLRNLEDARARLDQVLQAPAAAAAVDRHAILRGVVERATRAMVDGLPFPESAAREVLEPQIAQQEPAVHNEIRRAVSEQLADQESGAFVRGVDQALAVLREQLEELLDDVRDNGQDPDAILRLQLRYEQLRRAQLTLVRRYTRSTHLDLPADLCESVGFWRSSIDLIDRWVAARSYVAANSRTDTPAAAAFVQWLGDVQPDPFDISLTTPWWPTTDPAEHLRWLASSDEAWLPTIGEAVEAREAADAAVKRLFGRVTIEQAQARATYYRVTGAWDGYSEMPAEQYPITPRVISFAGLHDTAAPTVERPRAFTPKERL